MRRPALGAIAFAFALALAFWWQERQSRPPSEAPPPQGDLRPPAPPIPPPEPPSAPIRSGDPAPSARPDLTAPPTPQWDASAGGPVEREPAGARAPVVAGAPIAELPADEPGRGAKHLWKADAPGIKGAVQESLPELKECYEEWQKSAPGLRGRVAVAFRISSALDLDAGSAPEARVDQVRIGESELDHVFMEGCVSSVFSELRFAPPEGGKLEVTYPIRFESDEPPPP